VSTVAARVWALFLLPPQVAVRRSRLVAVVRLDLGDAAVADPDELCDVRGHLVPAAERPRVRRDDASPGQPGDHGVLDPPQPEDVVALPAQQACTGSAGGEHRRAVAGPTLGREAIRVLAGAGV